MSVWDHCNPPKKAISKTALGAEEVVAWGQDWDAVRMAEGLRRKGFEIAAIETSLHSVDLFECQPTFPVCVAFANEVDGLRGWTHHDFLHPFRSA